MSKIFIPYIEIANTDHAASVRKSVFRNGYKVEIDRVNWQKFSHKPKTSLFLGYTKEYLWLHYIVKNDFVRALYRKDQDAVWQDSCVEFFAMGKDKRYRNFEFNCLGVCLSETGANRKSRAPLAKSEMLQIIRYPELTSGTLPEEESRSDWQLTVGIPLELLKVEEGMSFKGNFYKCGDKTKIPHYLSWSPVNTVEPDFHRPEYFGRITLEKRNQQQ